MADLMAAGGGQQPPTSNGNGTGASVRRPTAAPAPTSSPSGIRGPRMIMQERAAREARQRAEAEQLALKTSRAEQEARTLEESRRSNPERRSAGVAERRGATAPTTSSQQQQQQQQTESQLRQSQAVAENTTTRHSKPSPPRSSTQSQPTQQPQQQQAQFAQAAQEPQSPPYTATAGGGQRPTQPTGNTTADPAAATSEPTKTRSSFPHAFERWETLSAHWEGLTSYWIRKLEQSKEDINRDPLSQQLARQVTDLSAAGANLFHAVVELQRLRASSERKFQRWFFETRAELERAQEVNAMMEKALERERQDRADAIRDAIDHERGSSKAQKQLAEMRKELSISKEEARRAWEELGRREQEERDRTLSLQSGHPTIVGGVQVVPMAHGGRQASRDAAAYQGDYSQGYSHAQSTAGPAPPPAAPPTTTQSPQHYHQGSRTGVPSEGGLSEGEYLIDAAGNFVLDTRGNRIPFVAAPPSGASGSDGEAEDYDTPATTNPPSGAQETHHQQQQQQQQQHASAAPDAQWTGTYSSPQDYSGQGYGAPGWETVPRHHHPTRLSDVMEEDDERSRTSASQISRVR